MFHGLYAMNGQQTGMDFDFQIAFEHDMRCACLHVSKSHRHKPTDNKCHTAYRLGPRRLFYKKDSRTGFLCPVDPPTASSFSGKQLNIFETGSRCGCRRPQGPHPRKTPKETR
jgi:hypothetical protein